MSALTCLEGSLSAQIQLNDFRVIDPHITRHISGTNRPTCIVDGSTNTTQPQRRARPSLRMLSEEHKPLCITTTNHLISTIHRDLPRLLGSNCVGRNVLLAGVAGRGWRAATEQDTEPTPRHRQSLRHGTDPVPGGRVRQFRPLCM